MKKTLMALMIFTLALVSCGPRSPGGGKVITVTIAPFAWFVEAIGGDDFTVNVLLPPGADHHIWEPLPRQISALSDSRALVINGQLDFELAWMERFRQVNPKMKILDLSRNIRLITSDNDHEDAVGNNHTDLHDNGVEYGSGTDDHHDIEAAEHNHDHSAGEGDDHQLDSHSAGTSRATGKPEAAGHGHSHHGPDPHYWMSPALARTFAADIRDFLAAMNPSSAQKYDSNLAEVLHTIDALDSLMRAAVDPDRRMTVLIYHPALAYTGRDYGFEQLSFEDEGKEPSPSRMKQLTDIARARGIKSIFIQAEYDVRNAQSLSRETGARLVVINPMNRKWPEAVEEVAEALKIIK